METLQRPPVGHWQLLQVGSARVPVVNAETTLRYESATATVELANGSTLDYYYGRRAPFRPGVYRHTGVYTTCDAESDCVGCGAVEEIDGVIAAIGVYVPTLFMRDYTLLPPVRELCYEKPTCVTYAWAMGKVTSVDAPFRTNDYLAPGVSEASIDGQLATPLREVTYPFWRYGRIMPRPLSDPNALQSESESASAEAQSDWYIPCERPYQCDPERFWPRTLRAASGASAFYSENWGCPTVIKMIAPGETLVRVKGNTIPRIQVVASGEAKFSIRNSLGTTTYTFPTTPGFKVYTDTDNGVATQLAYGDVASIVPGLLAIPSMEPFENVVHLERGMLTIGITPQWVM